MQLEECGGGEEVVVGVWGPPLFGALGSRRPRFATRGFRQRRPVIDRLKIEAYVLRNLLDSARIRREQVLLHRSIEHSFEAMSTTSDTYHEAS